MALQEGGAVGNVAAGVGERDAGGGTGAGEVECEGTRAARPTAAEPVKPRGEAAGVQRERASVDKQPILALREWYSKVPKTIQSDYLLGL